MFPLVLIPNVIRKTLIVLLTAGGAAGCAWCYYEHICMAGHMHHPPYPQWHVFADLGWALACVAAASLSLVVPGRSWKLLAIFLVVLLVYRFCLGSLGGLFSLPI